MPTEWAIAVVAVGLLTAANALLTLRMLRQTGARTSRTHGSLGCLREAMLQASDVRSGRRTATMLRPDAERLVAVFLSAGCSHCYRLVPQLNAFAQAHHESVAVIAVVAGSTPAATAFADARDLRVATISATDVAYAAPYTPYALVLDQADVIVAQDGVASREDLDRLVGIVEANRARATRREKTKPPWLVLRDGVVARRRVRALSTELRDHELGGAISIMAIRERRQHVEAADEATDAPGLQITMTYAALEALQDGNLFLPAALASGDVGVHGSLRMVGEAVDALYEINAQTSDNVWPWKPCATAAINGAAFAHATPRARTRSIDGGLLGAAMLASGTPLRRMFQIAHLNDSYLRSRVLPQTYHDLVLRLLDLAAFSQATTPPLPAGAFDPNPEVTDARAG